MDDRFRITAVADLSPGLVAAIAAGLEDERRHFVEQIGTVEAAAGMARFLGE